MKRIGRKNVRRVTLAILLGLGWPALAEVEFYQSVDRTEVGLDDTFRLTIVVTNAGDGAQIQFPNSSDFETLSRSQSTQTSYQIGFGGTGMKHTQKYDLEMKPNRVGDLILPAATLTAGGKTYKTEPIRITVKQGSLPGPRASRRRGTQGPFPGIPFPDFPGLDDDDLRNFPGFGSPRSQGELSLRASLDRQEAYVGEQVTFSVYILSSGELSAVDSVSMPKLEGFWSEDLESPTQLGAELKVINGVRYRAYLIKRVALFPVKPGALQIGPIEADITTGGFFSARRVHRASNELSVKVKPLPPGGPRGISSANVGKWHLSVDASPLQVELGQPVTVKVILEGRGNLKNTTLPALGALPSMRVFDPTTTDKISTARGRLGGRRTQEYIVMPQQTGSFTLPSLSFSYFDPESERYDVSKTDPIQLTVLPGAGAATVAGAGSTRLEGSIAKNVLASGGLRPLRYQAHFTGPSVPAWRQKFFLPIILGPPGLWLAVALVGLVRSRLTHEDETTLKRKRAKAARRRLALAERLKESGTPQAFYAEVENALLHFLAAKLGRPVVGLTRSALEELMASSGVSEAVRARILKTLEMCDVGRFSPDAKDGSTEQVLDEAEAAIAGWGRK